MKSLLLALCLAFAPFAAGAAHAVDYSGQYVGFSYSHGSLVAGINFTVYKDGSVLGRGTYLDFTEINLTGTVSASGMLDLVETDQGSDPYRYTARFTPNGKKFVARFTNGDVTRAKRVSANLPQAGVYYFRTDAGEDGVLFIDRGGAIYGVIYIKGGDVISLDGTADREGFDATDDDGVDYTASFDDFTSFSGTFDDGGSFYGDITGSKY